MQNGTKAKAWNEVKGNFPNLISRSSHPDVFYKKAAQNSQKSACARVFLLINFIKRRLQCSRFPVHFAKLLRILFLRLNFGGFF